MNRVDWLVLRRIASRVTITIVVFMALLAMVESLNVTKLRVLSSIGGPLLAAAGLMLSALWWSLGSLPVTVLIGTIAGVLDLQARREFLIVQASGYSIWRVIRGPFIAVLIFAAFASIAGQSLMIIGNRAMPGEPIANQATSTWLEQRGENGLRYILHAESLTANPPALYNVTLFMAGLKDRDRIEAEKAELVAGHWHFASAVRYRPDAPPETLEDFNLKTATSEADLYLEATGARDLTLPELLRAATSFLSEDTYRNVAMTSLWRTFMLPLTIAGSVLIGFATASGYRRTVRYGNVVLFGVVVGFILFTLNEMAVRAGNSGVLSPFVAAAGPAFLSILVGITALLYSQDGTLRG